MKIFHHRRPQRPAVSDVFFDVRRRVLSTRTPEYVLRINLGPLLRFVRRRRALLALTLLLAFVGTFGLAPTSAQVAVLYPSVCLGGWENPDRATGEPDSQDGYTAENAAVLHDAHAQIFCSGFAGDLPEDVTHTSVVLHMVWGNEMPRMIESQESEMATTTIVVDENFASSTSEIIDIPEDVPSEFIVPIDPVEPAPEPAEPETGPIEPDAAEPADATDPQPEPPIPLSFLATRAHAQEVASSTPEAAVAIPVPEETVSEEEHGITTEVPEPAPEVPQEAEATTTQETVLAESSYLLAILYTIDGTTWHELARVDDVYADRVFEISPDAFRSTADFSRLQVAVHSLPTLADRPPVYLDALWLEVAYQKQEEVPPPPPLLTERLYTKDITVDPEAVHRCAAVPFSTDLTQERHTTLVKVALNRPPGSTYELEVGGLPRGIDLRFAKSDAYTYMPEPEENTVSLRTRVQEGADAGNFTVPIIFTRDGRSTVVCQINLLNL